MRYGRAGSVKQFGALALHSVAFLNGFDIDSEAFRFPAIAVDSGKGICECSVPEERSSTTGVAADGPAQRKLPLASPMGEFDSWESNGRIAMGLERWTWDLGIAHSHNTATQCWPP
jgi:hypothetical protein